MLNFIKKKVGNFINNEKNVGFKDPLNISLLSKKK